LIELKTTVLKVSPTDLVIGRESIRKYHFFSEIPSQLAARPTVCSADSFANSTCCKATCGCQPKRRSLLQDGSPKGRFASQLSDLATSQTRGVLGALVDKSDNVLNRAAADVDEIDPASSDTFLPWSPDFFEADPLSKIHIFGDENQRKQILSLREDLYSATNSMKDQNTYLHST
jgi:hypothetical protein